MNDFAPDTTLDDLLDRLVATYADRHAGGDTAAEDLLAQVPEPHRPALQRCFKMIDSGLASGPAAQPVGPGTVLDGYRIIAEIGRGGMAVVYRAVQEDLSRPVALKLLRAGLALEVRNVDRFRREAHAIARLKHPNIVQIHAVGEAAGHHYIAMELVEGRTLAEVLDALPKPDTGSGEWGPEDLADAIGDPSVAQPGDTYAVAFCRMMVPVVRAVGVAHELGLVHRDIKPSNILFHKGGRPVVADFGLAKADGDPGLSLTGEPLGTPFYMSPEQAAVIDSPVDQRSDVYSLGVTLYEGLTGRRPFEGRTVVQVIEAIRQRIPPTPRSIVKSIGADADAVVRKAMSKMPEMRYATALDLSSELVAIAERRPTQAHAHERGGARALLRPFRWIFGGFQRLAYGEYVSERTLLGWPLVHITGQSFPGQPATRAKGWIACGEIATGFIAMGAMARGVFAFGGLAMGLVTCGGLSLGLLAMGGFALGAMSFGGFSTGYLALGGFAFGIYATGGKTFGVHAGDDGAKMFFERFFGGA